MQILVYINPINANGVLTMSKIISGFVLFFLLMALSLGVAFAESEAAPANETKNVTEIATMNATENLTMSASIMTRATPISLGMGMPNDPVMLQYNPVGAHIMNHQNGIFIPKHASQYHFGRDFSLGLIDNNYQGTPFLLQSLSDP